MQVKTVSWVPFKAAGMTQDKTRDVIRWAMAQFGLVCGLRLVSNTGSGKADIHIQGVNTNAWAGYTKGRNVSISTVRKMDARQGFVLGGVVMHEFGHAIGMKHTPQIEKYRSWLMHPWGPNDDWFSPEDVTWLQSKFGMPVADFYPHEITYWGNLLRSFAKGVRVMQANKRAWLKERARAGTTKERIAFLTDKIEVQDIAMEKLRESSVWMKAQRAAKILQWQSAAVPFCIVPKLSKSDKMLGAKTEVVYAEAKRQTVVCGSVPVNSGLIVAGQIEGV